MLDDLLSRIRSRGFALCNAYELFGDEWSVTLAMYNQRDVIAWGKGRSFVEAGEAALAKIEEVAMEYRLEQAKIRAFLNAHRGGDGPLLRRRV